MDDLLRESPGRRAVTVSELNRQARALLEGGIPKIWVEGEMSNLSRPGSGHVYFTLKDESAQLRCAWFRGRQRGPTINLKNGDQVLAFGQVSIYETRGEYQLVVERLQAAGEGELRRRFEVLKQKLLEEGLFDERLKKALPGLPRSIGVVTSPTGAAIRDILTVLGRRFPAVPVFVYPTAVQGEFAAAQIVAAIETAARRGECDVLIVSRGGGSLEDLWPFNEEIVARAIAACPISVVTAIGHEVDFTIADFVADLRAPTPSGAAELVVPDQAEWLRRLEATASRIGMLGRRQLEARFQSLDWLSQRLARSSPAATVARQREWLANLGQVMSAAVRHELSSRVIGLQVVRARLLARSPAIGVQRSIGRLDGLGQRLGSAAVRSVDRATHRLKVATRA
ncbi:MAG: exodeoxyribonuclease VII large subunit, partial [Gammaproteobacteria bacterium]|nr:exodeoxyribonuclease VII large subunit [Gammaproteobacteria bacterium]